MNHGQNWNFLTKHLTQIVFETHIMQNSSYYYDVRYCIIFIKHFQNDLVTVLMTTFYALHSELSHKKQMSFLLPRNTLPTGREQNKLSQRHSCQLIVHCVVCVSCFWVLTTKMVQAGVKQPKPPHAATAAAAATAATAIAKNDGKAGASSLIIFVVLLLAWLAGFSSRLFAVIRFESIIHEFDPW